MNTPNKPNSIEDDVVVSMDYTLFVDGEVVDSSEESGTIEFIQGNGEIIPGLEKALYGMKIGDTQKVHILAADGYGEVDPDAIVEVDRSEFPDEIEPTPGLEIQVKNDDGDILEGIITLVSKDSVEIDFNHPMAGKNLDFEVKIVELRDATEEELEHGHVHGEDWDDEDEEDEEDE